MRDLAGVDRERPQNVVEPGVRKDLGFIERRYRHTARAMRDLSPSQLDAFVGLDVRPQADAEIAGASRHGGQVALDHVEVEEQGRGFGHSLDSGVRRAVKRSNASTASRSKAPHT